MTKIQSTLIYITVFATGLFSLVYQTIWQRYLTFLVGADSLSSTLTLTVFLSALSLGYYLAGRNSEKIKGKELYFYGLVEFVIGIWAVIFPWLFKRSFSLVESGVLNGMTGDIILSVLLTALPATLMGITLPYLTQGLSKSFNSSSKTHAIIYAINTIGACFGALLAGFVLVKLIGMANSMFVIGSLNIGFGLLMMLLNKRNKQLQPNNEQISNNEVSTHEKVNQLPILIVAACSGYLLIAIESYIIRLFSMTTDGSIYAYPTVVTAFIAAIGIGAALSAKLMSRAHKIYALIPLIVMFFWLLIYFSIPQWPYADYVLKHWVVTQSNHFDYLPMYRFVLLFLIIGLPVIISSMLLPFSFHFFKNRKTSIGQTTGNLYAVATIATIVGGLVGGYWAFNYMNFQEVFLSYFLVMAIMSISSVWALKGSIGKYVGSFVVLLLFLVSLWMVPLKNFNKNLALSFYFQTPFANDVAQPSSSSARDWLWGWFDYNEIIATSVRAEGLVNIFNKKYIGSNPSRMIAINGRSNSGTTGTDYQGNALLSLFPYLMTESPKRVLIIGLGTGVTAGAIAIQKQVEKVDICEINAAVIKQLPLFDFATFNASQNPKINVIQSDVVKYLLRTEVEYDIIVSIPSNFWTAGIENLMMPEFYSIAQSKLTKGGTFIQWIPDYDFSERGLLTLIKSFTASFDESSLWRLTQDDLVLMYQKNVKGMRPWVDNRLYENTYLETMDAIDYSNPRQLKLAQIANKSLLIKLANFGEKHDLDTPNLGSIALDALYKPQENYSAENTIISHQ
jgi:spermidine synthase